ncbi:MAG: hypothetical protein KIT31_38120, partial [Deltaproteobacteria bacterium]|nr:hypothetical protein [Deltaproteobacteria bacterium]
MPKWRRAPSGARLPRDLVEAVARAAPHVERQACYGLAPWGLGTRLRVHLVPLGDLGLFERYELDARGFPHHVPFARLDHEAAFLAISTVAPYPIALWDAADRRLQPAWPSLDAFLGRLVAPGERSPGERLELALARGRRRVDDDRHADAIALLEPLGQRLDPSVHEASQAIRLWNLLGLAYKGARRFPDARAAFDRAARLGDTYGELNVLDLLLDELADPRAALAHAEAVRG